MPKKKQEAPKESKPFDSLLKALFDEQSEEIISCLLPGSQRPAGIPTDQLNVELNRNTISIDIGRHIVYKEEHATFNLEAKQVQTMICSRVCMSTRLTCIVRISVQ